MSRKPPGRRAAKQTSSRKYLLALIPVILAIVAYWNSFDAPLVFDDLVSIQKHAAVRFGDIFHANLLGPRKLLYLTFGLDYQLHGQEVWGYHFVNLAFHALNGLLIFFIAEHIFSFVLQQKSRAQLHALLAAGCFVLHPIQTESVTYISSRSELFSTFFFVAAVLIFLKWQRTVGFGLSFIIIAVYLLGLGGKETAITLPLVLVLYDWLFMSNGQVKPILSRWRFYSPFVAGGLIAGIYIAMPLFRSTVGAVEGNLSYLPYALTQTRVVVRYIGLLLLPLNQNLDYDVRPSTTFLDPWVLLSTAVILAVMYYGWHVRKRQPIVTFSIFWFFITLSPTSSFIPILDVMFEHRLYLPMVGACLLFPLLVAELAKIFERSFTFRITETGVAAVILIMLCIATIRRNEIWRSEVTLWQDAMRKSPYKGRPYNSLSMAYFKRGEYDKAAEVSEHGRDVNPQLRTDFNETLGNMYLKAGKFDKAEVTFRENAQTENTPLAYNNLAVAYQYMWDQLKLRRQLMSESDFLSRRDVLLTKARDAYGRAVSLDPSSLWFLDGFVNVEFDLGHSRELEASTLEKLRDGDRVDLLYIVAKLHFLKDDFAGAIPYFERAEKLVPGDEKNKLFFFNFGTALDGGGQLDRAAEEYTRAVQIDPIFLEAYHNLGIVLYKKKDYQAARRNFTEALAADPNHPSAYQSHLYLGRIAYLLGEFQTARTELQTVLRLSPNNADAQQLLQRIASQGGVTGS